MICLAVVVILMAAPGPAMSIAPGSGNPPPTYTSVSCQSAYFVLGLSNGVYCTASVKAQNEEGLGGTYFTFSMFDVPQYHDTGAVVFPYGHKCTIPSGKHACEVFVAGTNAGNVWVQASYSGDGIHGAPSGGVAYVTVKRYPTTTAVACDPSSFLVGGNSTCTATVSGGQSPTGTVTFLQYSGTGSVALPDPATCTLTSGSCSLNVTGAISGSVVVQGTYGGDADNAVSSGDSASLTVQQTAPLPEREPTTTTVSCAPTSFAAGYNSTCTATVSGTGSPTGTVAFSQPSGTGTVTLPVPATCLLASGTCSLNITGAVSGNVTVEASYGGDADNAVSSGNLTLTVYPPLATPTVSASATAVDQGQTSNLTSQAVAGGIPPYLLQWYEEPPGSAVFTAITGATSSNCTFATSASTETGAWAFELQVNDSSTPSETAFSIPFVVSVNQSLAAPDVSPSSTLVHGGHSISVKVTWSGGTQPYEVDLYNSSTPDCSSGYTLVASASGITGLTTTFDGVAPASATYYCALVTDSASAPETNASSSPEVFVGHVATFNASVDGALDVASSTTVLNVATGGSGSDCSGGVLAAVSEGQLPYSTSILTPGTEVCYSYSSVVASTSTGKQYTYDSTASATGSASGQTGRTGSFTIYADSAVNSTYAAQWQASMSTKVQPGSSEPLGTPIYDTASIGETVAGLTPAGTVTYGLYSGSDTCTGMPTTWLVTLNANGSVPQSAPQTLAAGSYGYVANYSGDSNYLGATSGCEPLAISKGAVTIFTSIDPSGTPSLGVPVNDTATATGVSGFTPTGTVTIALYSGASCNGGLIATYAGVELGSPQSIPRQGAGQYSFLASDYSGDGNYTAGTSGNCEPFTIIKAVLTIDTVLDSASPLLLGSTEQDTATLGDSVSGFTPAGTVTYSFFAASASCTGASSTQTVVLSGGTAPSSATTSSLAAGSYSYDATYSGDGNYTSAGPSACEPVTVQQAQASITTLVRPSSSVVLGTPTHDTAAIGETVSGFMPMGTVTYNLYRSASCAGVPTTETVALSGGSVPQSRPQTLLAGEYSYSATYSGDSNYIGARSGCEPLAIQTPTIMVLVCTPPVGTVGVPDSCTVFVANTYHLYDTRASGLVAFSGGLPPGMPTSCVLTGGLGTVSSCTVHWTLGKGTEGSYHIAASYGGDSTHIPSSARSTLTIVRRGVSAVVSCSAPYRRGAPITCTVTVTDNDYGTPFTPTGIVAFSANGPGLFSSLSCSLSGSGATASCHVAFTPAERGLYTVTASYGGDGDHFARVASATFRAT